MGEGHREGGEKKTFLGAPGGWLKCSPSARVARLSREETEEQPAPAPSLRQGPFPRSPRAPQTPPPGRGPGWEGGRLARRGVGDGQGCGRRGSSQCLLDAGRAPVAHPRLRCPRRLRAGAEQRGWRSRRLEGAALAVARGRLNPLLPLQGLGKEGGAKRVGSERRREQRAAGVSGSSSPPPPTLTPTAAPPPAPATDSLPVGPPLVGRGCRQPQHFGGRSLHDSGWDGGRRGGDWI